MTETNALGHVQKWFKGFEHGIGADARQAGLSISEIADLPVF